MTSTKTLLHTAFLASGLSLCLAVPAMAGSASFDQVLAETEASLSAARESGNSWTSTDKLVAAAKQALEAGNPDDAMELAKRALLTADIAREQEQLEQDAWQSRVPAN